MRDRLEKWMLACTIVVLVDVIFLLFVYHGA
jgi:hypothetical protein